MYSPLLYSSETWRLTRSDKKRTASGHQPLIPARKDIKLILSISRLDQPVHPMRSYGPRSTKSPEVVGICRELGGHTFRKQSPPRYEEKIRAKT